MREGHAPACEHPRRDGRLMAEVVEDHVRTHLVDANVHPDALDPDAVEQLLAIVRTYLK